MGEPGDEKNYEEQQHEQIKRDVQGDMLRARQDQNAYRVYVIQRLDILIDAVQALAKTNALLVQELRSGKTSQADS